MNFVKTHILLLIVFCLIFPVHITFGATENFPVQALIGGDSTPPTTPTSLVATGVATTQIDLTWASSTDNFLLGGYHVWRDNVHIGTTTLPQYSDTGLTASTSYVYYVTAYDSSFNFSASSSVATGTTLATVVTPTTTQEATGGSVFGSKAHPFEEEITALVVLPHTDSVTIRFETKSAIRTVVRWGEGSSYETGSLIENEFSRTHEVVLTNLIPGKKYEFILEGENGIGKRGVLHTGTFVTLPPVDIFPPDNVLNLTVTKKDSDLILNWKNPEDADFAKIRIVYSDQFYPSDTADGMVVYEGKSEDFKDEGRGVIPGSHYYTIFSYDALGNISSGAVVSITIDSGGDVRTNVPEAGNPAQNEMKLSLSDLIFTQEGQLIKPEGETITIDGSKQLSITIPYNRVPEHLKTILVRVESSADPSQSFSFLLRINKDKTGYTSTLAPFGISGTFPFVVTVFDFKTAQVGYTRGLLDSRFTPSAPVSKVVPEEWFSFGMIRSQAYIIWFIVLLVLLTLAGRRIMHAKW